MSGIPMTAIARQIYQGKPILIGQKFDAASEADAADLVAVRMATRDKPVAAVFKPMAAPTAIATPEMVARVVEPVETEPDDVPADTGEKPENSGSKALAYSRRDMRAKK